MNTFNFPYTERTLTSTESANGDVKRFLLPGHDHIVEIVGPLRLALWLLTAFDPQCTACVVRPRQLTLHHNVKVELDIWAACRDGTERFIHLVSDKDCQSGPTGRVFRDATLWAEAAQKTAIPLAFFYERDIVSKGQRVANFFRMLPNVQASYHLPERLLLRERIKEFFITHPAPMTFEQVKSGLHGLDDAEVHSILCGYIFEGDVTFDADRPLGERTVLTWAAQAHTKKAAA